MSIIWIFLVALSATTTTTAAVRNGDVRLTGFYEGLLEVYHEGSWGSVCHDYASDNLGKVVCRNLNRRFVGLEVEQLGSTDRFLLDDVICLGAENNLDECEHRTWGYDNCRYTDHILVTCESCLTSKNCSQICPSVSQSNDDCGCYTGYTLNIDNTTCDDVDECLVNNGTCSHLCINTKGGYKCDCPSDQYLDVDKKTCIQGTYRNGDVRLSEYHKGLLEVFYRESWGSVCDDRASDMLGIVVCHNLNRRFASIKTSQVGNSNGFLLDEVNCNGTESNLAECQHAPWSIEDCYLDEHIYITCTNCATNSKCSQTCLSANLTNDECSCYHGYTLNSDNTTCDDINECSLNNGNCSHQCNNTIGGYRCGCPEDSYLSSDNKTCIQTAHKNGDVRLSHFYKGLLEVFYQGRWGAVCDDAVDDAVRDALGRVVCGNIGRDFVSIEGRQRGDTSKFLLDEVNCVGHESNLAECEHALWGKEDCSEREHIHVMCGQCFANGKTCSQICPKVNQTHDNCACNPGYTLNIDNTTCEDVDECLTNNDSCTHQCINTIGAYTCKCPKDLYLDTDNKTCIQDEHRNGDVRLSDTYKGLLEVFYRGRWGPVCDDVAKHQDLFGQVVCQNIGREYVSMKTDQRGKTNNEVKCNGTENNLAECQHDPWGIHDCGELEHIYVLCEKCLITSKSCSQICPAINQTNDNCGCYPGYTLNSDNTTCDDVNECEVKSDKCSHQCNNIIGGYKCSCPKDLYLSADNNTCIQGAHRNGDVRLTNTHQGLLEVFYQGEWGAVCNKQIANEERLRHVVCRNLGRKYISTDPSPDRSMGLTVNFLLSEVDCYGTESNLAECQHAPWRQNNCVSREFTYVACTENSCKRAGSRCSHCSNTNQTIEKCECYTGYVLDKDGISCSDVNECLMNSGYKYCSHKCINTIGGYMCACPEDFYLDTNNKTCKQSLHRSFDVRLSNGYEGQLEVYYKREWMALCDHMVSDNLGKVVCRSLNLDFLSIRGEQKKNSNKVVDGFLTCNGDESSLVECNFGRYSGIRPCFSDHIYVTCGEPIQDEVAVGNLESDTLLGLGVGVSVGLAAILTLIMVIIVVIKKKQLYYSTPRSLPRIPLDNLQSLPDNQYAEIEDVADYAEIEDNIDNDPIEEEIEDADVADNQSNHVMNFDDDISNFDDDISYFDDISLVYTPPTCVVPPQRIVAHSAPSSEHSTDYDMSLKYEPPSWDVQSAASCSASTSYNSFDDSEEYTPPTFLDNQEPVTPQPEDYRAYAHLQKTANQCAVWLELDNTDKTYKRKSL